jgi:RNA polymerase sigma-70 factor (sigma-E family)
VEGAASHIEIESVGASDAGFVEMLGDELPRLQRIARLLVGNGDVADDIVAEAIARTLPKWRTGSVADPAAYVRRVTVNLVNRRWRRRRLSLRSDHAALTWTADAADHSVVSAERHRTLRALQNLPARRRAVVVLRYYDDMPEATIAATLGISIGTVKSTLSRALEQLRIDLETQDSA